MAEQVAPASGCCAACGAPAAAVLKLRDVARLFGVSYWTARRWWDEGDLPDPLTLPGPARWNRQTILDFMTKRSAQGRRKPRPSERGGRR